MRVVLVFAVALWPMTGFAQQTVPSLVVQALAASRRWDVDGMTQLLMEAKTRAQTSDDSSLVHAVAFTVAEDVFTRLSRPPGMDRPDAEQAHDLSIIIDLLSLAWPADSVAVGNSLATAYMRRAVLSLRSNDCAGARNAARDAQRGENVLKPIWNVVVPDSAENAKNRWLLRLTMGAIEQITEKANTGIRRLCTE